MADNHEKNKRDYNNTILVVYINSLKFLRDANTSEEAIIVYRQ